MFKVCDAPALGFDVSTMGSDTLDDACGAGTSDMDFSAADYLSTMEVAIDLLESIVSLSIPADEISETCEVR